MAGFFCRWDTSGDGSPAWLAFAVGRCSNCFDSPALCCIGSKDHDQQRSDGNAGTGPNGRGVAEASGDGHAAQPGSESVTQVEGTDVCAGRQRWGRGGKVHHAHLEAGDRREAENHP